MTGRHRQVGRRLRAAVVALAAVAIIAGIVSLADGGSTGATARRAAADGNRAGGVRPTTTPSNSPSSAPSSAPSPASARSLPPSGLPVPMHTTEVTTTRSITVNGGQRSYEISVPAGARAPLPVLMMLHGQKASVAGERQRDQLDGLVTGGQAILVYPVGYEASWNAGGCCGAAAAAHVDDVAFLSAVVRDLRLDPLVDSGAIVLMGYSNGGRMAFTLECARPGMFAAVIIIDALPTSRCASEVPKSLLMVAGIDDHEVQFADDAPDPDASVVGLVENRRVLDGCGASPSEAVTGHLRVREWPGCAGGMRVRLAIYSGYQHTWPVGDDVTPSAASVVEAFLHDLSLT